MLVSENTARRCWTEAFHFAGSNFYLEGKVICHHPFISIDIYGLILAHGPHFMKLYLLLYSFYGRYWDYNTMPITVAQSLKAVQQFISDLSVLFFSAPEQVGILFVEWHCASTQSNNNFKEIVSIPCGYFTKMVLYLSSTQYYAYSGWYSKSQG